MLAHLGIVACHSLQWVDLCCLTLRTLHMSPRVSNRLHSKCVIHRRHMLAVTPMYVRHRRHMLAVTPMYVRHRRHMLAVTPMYVRHRRHMLAVTPMYVRHRRHMLAVTPMYVRHRRHMLAVTPMYVRHLRSSASCHYEVHHIPPTPSPCVRCHSQVCNTSLSLLRA